MTRENETKTFILKSKQDNIVQTIFNYFLRGI